MLSDIRNNSEPRKTPGLRSRTTGIFHFQSLRLRQATLRSKGINYLEKRKLIEIGVAGATSRNTVFAHKDGGVRVVEQIAGKVRQLQNNLFGDGGVPFGWNKNCEAWRGEQRRNKIPSRRCAPW